ncbi:YEATS domain-containing protein 2 [Gonapodya sp. JEL0774]|nr:YEATS domain-containing protein 2 [Gonapodya sp. JEL0774]
MVTAASAEPNSPAVDPPPFLLPKHTRRPPKRKSLLPASIAKIQSSDLEQPLQKAREAVLRSIVSEYEDFLSIYIPTSSIDEDLQEIAEKLDQCDHSDKRTIVFANRLDTLRMLYKAHTLLLSSTTLLDEADIRGAAALVDELNNLVEDVGERDMAEDEKGAFDLLKSSRLPIVTKLRHTLRSLLLSAIRLHLPTPASAQLTVRPRVLSTHAKTYYEDTVDLIDAWEAAEMAGGVVEGVGRVVVETVDREMFSRVMEGCKVVDGGGRMIVWVKVEKEKGQIGGGVATSLVQLTTLLQFLSTHIPDTSTARTLVLAPLWRALWARAARAVEEHTPPARNEMVGYIERVGEPIRLLEKAARDCGLLQTGSEPARELLLSLHTVRVQKRRQEILALAREVLAGDPDAGVRVTEGTERGGLASLGDKHSAVGGSSKGGKHGSGKSAGTGGLESSLAAFRLPSMQVTAAAQAVVEMAYATLDEAKNLAGGDKGADDANDCIYVNYHLTTMRWQGLQEIDGVLGEVGTFADMVPLFRAVGERVWGEEMALQREKLLGYLEPLRNIFVDSVPVGINDWLEAVEGSIRAAAHHLDAITRVWKHILTSFNYLKAVGALLDSLVNELEQLVLTTSRLAAMTPAQKYQLRQALGVVSNRAGGWFEILEEGVGGVGAGSTMRKLQGPAPGSGPTDFGVASYLARLDSGGPVPYDESGDSADSDGEIDVDTEEHPQNLAGEIHIGAANGANDLRENKRDQGHTKPISNTEVGEVNDSCGIFENVGLTRMGVPPKDLLDPTSANKGEVGMGEREQDDSKREPDLCVDVEGLDALPGRASTCDGGDPNHDTASENCNPVLDNLQTKSDLTVRTDQHYRMADKREIGSNVGEGVTTGLGRWEAPANIAGANDPPTGPLLQPILSRELDLEIFAKMRERADIRREMDRAEEALWRLGTVGGVNGAVAGGVGSTGIGAGSPSLSAGQANGWTEEYQILGSRVKDSQVPNPPRRPPPVAREPTPATKTNGTGTVPQLILRRDDRYFAVNCLAEGCGRGDFTTIQGFVNHVRMAHNLNFGTHEETVLMCGTEISEAEVPPGHPARRRNTKTMFSITGVLDRGRKGSSTPRSKARIKEHSPSAPVDIDASTDFQVEDPALRRLSGAALASKARKLAIDKQAKESAPGQMEGMVDMALQYQTQHQHADPQHPSKRQKTSSSTATSPPTQSTFAPKEDLVRPRAGAASQPAIPRTAAIAAGQIDTGQLVPPPMEGSRFYVKKKLVVGNVSKYLSKKQRDPKWPECTHKWMMFVCGLPPDDHPETFVRSVRFSVHESYAPNNVIEIHEPPFYLTRFGWGEFPVKVEVIFVDEKRNRMLEFLHELKLDQRHSGAQVLGGETVYEIELDRNTNFAPSRNHHSEPSPGLLDPMRGFKYDRKTLTSANAADRVSPKIKRSGNESTESVANFSLRDTVREDRGADTPESSSTNRNGSRVLDEEAEEDGDEDSGSAVYAVSDREPSVPPLPDGVVYEALRVSHPLTGQNGLDGGATRNGDGSDIFHSNNQFENQVDRDADSQVSNGKQGNDGTVLEDNQDSMQEDENAEEYADVEAGEDDFDMPAHFNA